MEAKKDWGTQVVKRLPKKHKALSSNPNIARRREGRKETVITEINLVLVDTWNTCKMTRNKGVFAPSSCLGIISIQMNLQKS
jgi:hypothetical protein